MSMLAQLQPKMISEDLALAHAPDWSVVQLWFRGEHIGDINGEHILRDGVSGTLPDGSAIHLQLYGPSYFADIEVLRDGALVKKAVSNKSVVPTAVGSSPATLAGSPYASRGVPKLEPRPAAKRDIERAGNRLFFIAAMEVLMAFAVTSVIRVAAHTVKDTAPELAVAANRVVLVIWVIFGILAALWGGLGALCRFRHSGWAAIIGFGLYLANFVVTLNYTATLPIVFYGVKLFGLAVLGKGAMAGLGEHWRRRDAKRAAAIG
jgi:hypothetical protein